MLVGAGADPVGPAQDRRLDRSLWRSLAWVGGSRWAIQALTWASTLVVARLLGPTDYGIVGMASVYVGFAALLADSGLGSSVVTLRSLNHRQISQVHTMSGVVGTCLFAVSCLLAWPVGLFFDTPQLPAIIIVMSSIVAFMGWQSVPDALLQKQFRFRYLAFRDTTRAIVAAACTVVLALSGMGYWALAIGPVVGAAAALLMSLAAQRLPLATPRVRDIRDAISFSSYTLSGRLVWYGYSNADFLVAGKVLSTASFGAYTLAWSLANISVEKVSALVGRVTPSFFSAVQSDRVQLRRYFGTLNRAIALAAFPVSAGIALLAADFVPVILGHHWDAAIAPLVPLAMYAGFRALVPILAMVLRVTGDLRYSLIVGIITLCVMPIVFYVGSKWGPVGIAYGWVAAYPILVIPQFARVFRRLSMGPRLYLQWISPALISTAMMAGVVLTVKSLAPETWPVGLRLALCVITGVLSYVGALLLFFRGTLNELRTSMRGTPAPILN